MSILMAADDPRHGTYAGAVAHWFGGGPICPPCRQAETRYRKRRKLRALNGHPATVPSIGTIRRVRALHALGWTGPEIAEGCGVSINTLRTIAYRGIETIHATTAAKVASGYERMSMRVSDGAYAGRTRRFAARKGWPVPLAWDNIDDPDENPTDWQYRPASRRDVLVDLDHRNAGVSEACSVLNLRRDSLEKWCERNDLAALYGRMVCREQPNYEALTTGWMAS